MRDHLQARREETTAMNKLFVVLPLDVCQVEQLQAYVDEVEKHGKSVPPVVKIKMQVGELKDTIRLGQTALLTTVLRTIADTTSTSARKEAIEMSFAKIAASIKPGTQASLINSIADYAKATFDE